MPKIKDVNRFYRRDKISINKSEIRIPPSDFIILSPQTLVLSPLLYLLALYHKPAPLISPGLTFDFLGRAIAGK